MDYNIALHAHKGIIYLFLFNLTVKTVLMIASPDVFNSVRNRTKIVEMILGTLVLVSGIYMWSIVGWMMPTWLMVKIVLVFAGIPMGIIAMKKGNKVLAVATLVLFFFLFMVARSKSLTLSDTSPSIPKQANACVLSQKPFLLSNQTCANAHSFANANTSSVNTLAPIWKKYCTH